MTRVDTWLDADLENGPAARSFAADAHDCIMVRFQRTYRIQVCGAKIRARWRAPLGSSCTEPTNTETRHWEKMQRASSGLTTNAPYKPAPAKAGVPQTIAFQTKPAIALEQIKAARAAGLPAGVVLMDAGYGNDTGLRTEITALGLRYVAGIGPNTSVWPPGAGPLPPPQRRRGGGRPAKLLRRDGEHQPLSAKACPGEGRGARCRPAGTSVANHHLARRQRRLALIALRTAAGAAVGLQPTGLMGWMAPERHRCAKVGLSQLQQRESP